MSERAAKTWVINPVRAGLFGWLFRYGLIAVLIAGVVSIAAGRALYRHYNAQLPELASITEYRSRAPGVSYLHDRDGAVLSILAREHRAYAPISEIPVSLREAFIAAEDRRFLEHAGIDLRGIARAMLANVRAGTIAQGGSTITQQVAKSFLGTEQTLERKLKEAILAVRLESRLDKDQILEIYLNKIFLGSGAYGVRAAAARYFGKPLEQLSIGEQALLAGLARAPSRDHPRRSEERAQRRRGLVLRAMADEGFITDDEFSVAQSEPIRLAKPTWDPFRWRLPYYAEHVRKQLMDALGPDAPLLKSLQVETFADPLAGEHARESMMTELTALDRRQGWRGPIAHIEHPDHQASFIERTRTEYGLTPLRSEGRWYLGLVEDVDPRDAIVRVGPLLARMTLVTTSWAAPYDTRTGANNAKTSSLTEVLEVGDVVWVRGRFQENRSGERTLRHGDEGRPLVSLMQVPRVEGAILASDTTTGAVIAMEGGFDYDRSQFNRATQACRQPGSVFKAIYYALALDNGNYEIDSILQHRAWEPEPGESWNPQDIVKTPDGRLLFRTAFIKSLNTPSIRLFLDLGADNVAKWARHLGIRSTLIADKALSLGASCVLMGELSQAFGMFANNGRAYETHTLARVIDQAGNTLYDVRPIDTPGLDVAGRLRATVDAVTAGERQIIDEKTAFLTTSLMRDVVRAGTGIRATRLGVPAAGKSGTASKGQFTTDAWFVGFTSNVLTAAWVGDDTYARSLGNHEASYTTATPMWTRFMRTLSKGRTHKEIPWNRPPGVEKRLIDATLGGPSIPGLPSAWVYYVPAWSARAKPHAFHPPDP